MKRWVNGEYVDMTEEEIAEWEQSQCMEENEAAEEEVSAS